MRMRQKISVNPLKIPQFYLSNGVLSEQASRRKCDRPLALYYVLLQIVRDHAHTNNFPIESSIIPFSADFWKLSAKQTWRVLRRGEANGLWLLTTDKKTHIRYLVLVSYQRVLDAFLPINPTTGKPFITSFSLRPSKALRGTLAMLRAELTKDSAERYTDNPRGQALIGKQVGASRQTVNRRLKQAKARVTRNWRVVLKSETVKYLSEAYYRLKDEFLEFRKFFYQSTQRFLKFCLVRLGDGNVQIAVASAAPNTYHATGHHPRTGKRGMQHRWKALEKRRKTTRKTAKKSADIASKPEWSPRLREFSKNILAALRISDFKERLPYVRQNELSFLISNRAGQCLFEENTQRDLTMWEYAAFGAL